jgi:hypothetical protein
LTAIVWLRASTTVVRDAHDALKLLAAMRAMASPMIDAIADQGMLLHEVRGIKVAFPGGVAVVESPEPGAPPIVKTVLPPQ